jgi:glycosyltransferase involved in cell wall biosynthesis
VKLAFLLNDLQLSGGVGVAVQHARQLAVHHGHDVTLVLVREQEQAAWEFDGLAHLHVEGLAEARAERFDIAIATWWETTFSLFDLRADRYAYFVQSLEERFYHPGEPERWGAALTHDLPVAFLTEARWIADTLAQLRPDAPCHLVRNGIDKQGFAIPDALPPRVSGPLRIVVEGNPHVWFKGVVPAVSAVRRMAEPHHLTVVTSDHAAVAGDGVDRVVGPLTHAQMVELYDETDVVLKLSRVEGMFGPPLEGFHRGATCVTTPVTGHEEYVEHGWNGLVVDWDDEAGTARQLDLLARDRRLLHFLRTNARETARGWPSWEQAGMFMAAAVASIQREPPPSPAPAASALTHELRAGIELHRRTLQERNEFAHEARPVQRVKASRSMQQLQRARFSRPGQLLLRPLRPFLRRLRARLLG